MHTFPFIVGSIMPKSVKCIHSATKLECSRVLQILSSVDSFGSVLRLWVWGLHKVFTGRCKGIRVPAACRTLEP